MYASVDVKMNVKLDTSTDMSVDVKMDVQMHASADASTLLHSSPFKDFGKSIMFWTLVDISAVVVGQVRGRPWASILTSNKKSTNVHHPATLIK